MALPNDIDKEKLAEIALAILWLGAHGDEENIRVWKGIDWDVMAVLHEKGWISDPIGKQKAVALSSEGARLAEEYFAKHFHKRSEA